MAVGRWVFSALCALLLAVRYDAAGAVQRDATFPFIAGTTWTYDGDLRWTVMNGNHVRATRVRRRSTVVDAFDRRDISGALIQGSVWDLARWSPDARPEIWAVLRVGARYYLLQDDAKTTFEALKWSGRRVLPAGVDDLRWFDVPPLRGKLHRARDVAPRRETRYAWWIDRAATGGPLVPAELSHASVTKSTSRSCPAPGSRRSTTRITGRSPKRTSPDRVSPGPRALTTARRHARARTRARPRRATA